MTFTLGIAQTGFPNDGDVPSLVEDFAAQAERLGVDILAFPENLMCPRELSIPELRALAEPLDGPFVQAMGDIARRHGLWLVITTYEKDPAGGAPFNCAVVLDDHGCVRGSYHKCHLYDAHGVRESDRMGKGDALFSPIETPFCKLGVGICYDLRFPELARAAALAGCELLLYPAAWHDGPAKPEHWETLLRARAIENELFVAGICHAQGRYTGLSLVADPLGAVLVKGPAASGEKTEALLTCEIDTDAVKAARDAMPVLSHRRPELY